MSRRSLWSNTFTVYNFVYNPFIGSFDARRYPGRVGEIGAGRNYPEDGVGCFGTLTGEQEGEVRLTGVDPLSRVISES